MCFMIMPYCTKAVADQHASSIPTEMDFDRLWEAALKPSIEELGYEPVRDDQDLGALIINEMIERLAISDLVVADVTIANANVYYEIGIRHAAKRLGSVTIAADWARPVFYIPPDASGALQVASQRRRRRHRRTDQADSEGEIPPLAAESPFFFKHCRGIQISSTSSTRRRSRVTCCNCLSFRARWRPFALRPVMNGPVCNVGLARQVQRGTNHQAPGPPSSCCTCFAILPRRSWLWSSYPVCQLTSSKYPRCSSKKRPAASER